MAVEVTGTNKERFDKTIRRKDKLTSFLYDLAKACFTLMVVAGLWMFFTQGFTMNILGAIAFGLISTFCLAWLANRIMIY